MSISSNSPAEQSIPSASISLAKPREGVSFEDVKRVVEKLTQKGLRASLRLVRAELGTGSLSTVHKHLQALRSLETSVVSESPPPLSSQVLRALATEVERTTLERTSRIDTELRDAQSSIELLLQENEALRAAALVTAESAEKLRESLAESAGTLDALRAQLTAVNAQLTSAQSSAETARQSLAVLQEQRHAAEGRAEQLAAELRAGHQELLSLRQELTDSRRDAEEARCTVAALEVQVRAKQQLEEQFKASTAAMQQRIQELEAAQVRLAVSESERTIQAERMKEMKAALARAEENAQQLLDKLLSGTQRAAGTANTKK